MRLSREIQQKEVGHGHECSEIWNAQFLLRNWDSANVSPQNKSLPSAWQPFAELRCLWMGSVEGVSGKSPKDSA